MRVERGDVVVIRFSGGRPDLVGLPYRCHVLDVTEGAEPVLTVERVVGSTGRERVRIGFVDRIEPPVIPSAIGPDAPRPTSGRGSVTTLRRGWRS